MIDARRGRACPHPWSFFEPLSPGLEGSWELGRRSTAPPAASEHIQACPALRSRLPLPSQQLSSKQKYRFDSVFR